MTDHGQGEIKIHKSNTLFKFDYSKLEKLKKIIEIQPIQIYN